MGCVDKFLNCVIVDDCARVVDGSFALFAREVGIRCH